jgi:hypothetical protein
MRARDFTHGTPPLPAGSSVDLPLAQLSVAEPFLTQLPPVPTGNRPRQFNSNLRPRTIVRSQNPSRPLLGWPRRGEWKISLTRGDPAARTRAPADGSTFWKERGHLIAPPTTEFKESTHFVGPSRSERVNQSRIASGGSRKKERAWRELRRLRVGVGHAPGGAICLADSILPIRQSDSVQVGGQAIQEHAQTPGKDDRGRLA